MPEQDVLRGGGRGGGGVGGRASQAVSWTRTRQQLSSFAVALRALNALRLEMAISQRRLVHVRPHPLLPCCTNVRFIRQSWPHTPPSKRHVTAVRPSVGGVQSGAVRLSVSQSRSMRVIVLKGFKGLISTAQLQVCRVCMLYYPPPPLLSCCPLAPMCCLKSPIARCQLQLVSARTFD